MVNPRVFIDLEVGEKPLGRVVFELFQDVVPKTVENFRCLATGERGASAQSGVPLSYKGSVMHRVIPGFMVQGGDFTKKNGTGGESIYGGTFEDENFDLPLDAEGQLVMANRGPNTNGSQFFVTLRACPHLNGKHVVFGRVVKGYEIIQQIATFERDAKDRPLTPVVVTNTGELVLKKKAAPAPSVPPPTSAMDVDGGAGEKRGRSLSRSRSRSRSGSVSRSRSRTRSKSKSVGKSGGKRRRIRSPSDSRSRSRSHSPSRSRSRSLSRSVSRSPSPERKKSKKSKSKKMKEDKKSKEKKVYAVVNGVVTDETEEELDARLEREEMERKAEQKRREAERLKSKLASSGGGDRDRSGSSGRDDGVRLKGRGLMKYRDPDHRRDH